MFNKLYQIVKKYVFVITILSFIFSCKEDVKIDFSEENIETSKDAEISINFPKAEGNKAVSELINTTLQNHIVSQTNLGEDSLTNLSIEDAVKRFNTEFKSFTSDFPKSSQ